MPPHPDQEMLTLLARRDPRGFDQAYAKYGARLFRSCVDWSGGPSGRWPRICCSKRSSA